jgi:chromate reductase, NAD(P)H dehydrogenase (quinone)
LSDLSHSAVRVLTICGSPRPDSANRALIETVSVRAQDLQAAVETFDDLYDIGPFDPDLVGQPEAAVASLRARVAAADAVVIAGPEYAGALAGVVKNALDWLVGSGEMWDRTVGVACAGTTGGWFARRDLAQTLAWQGALVVAHLGISSPMTKRDADGQWTDAATIGQIELFTDELLAAAQLPRSERIRMARSVATEFRLDPLRVAGGVEE